MKASCLVAYCLLTAVSWLIPQSCHGSFFDMSLKQNSIYTPGTMRLTMMLSEKARIDDGYRLQLSVFVSDTLVRKRIIPIIKATPVTFELMLPGVRSRTDARCRAELFIDSEFLEARERPLTLWPTVVSSPNMPTDQAIWVFDISGQLQKLLGNLGIPIADATFQAVRDFETPRIVFIGQETDANSMEVVAHRLAGIEAKPVVVFLKQKRFPGSAEMDIPKGTYSPQRIVCNRESALLQSLTKHDIMNMLENVEPIRIIKAENEDVAIESFITDVVEDNEYMLTYLCAVRKQGQVTVYCQLSVTDSSDPRAGVLLNNLLRFAGETANPKKNEPVRNRQRR